LWSRTDTNTLINGGTNIQSNSNLIDDILTNTSTQTQQAVYTLYVNHESCQSAQNSITLTVNIGAPISFEYNTPEVKCSGVSPTDLFNYFSPNHSHITEAIVSQSVAPDEITALAPAPPLSHASSCSSVK